MTVVGGTRARALDKNCVVPPYGSGIVPGRSRTSALRALSTGVTRIHHVTLRSYRVNKQIAFQKWIVNSYLYTRQYMCIHFTNKIEQDYQTKISEFSRLSRTNLVRLNGRDQQINIFG